MTDQQDLRKLATQLEIIRDKKTTNIPDGQVINVAIIRLREAAAQLGRMERPEAYAVYGKSEEFGPVLLSEYVGSMDVIRNRVMEKARREGFAGDFVQRMAELGWWIEPLYPRPQLPAGVPDGWKLVPVEPTDDMLEAYQEAMCGLRNMTSVDDNELVILWSAMLAAAPQPDNKESK